MDKNVIEVAELATIGFKPIVLFESWRVATLCYAEDLYPPNISYLERHMETDEVFILMAGQATLMLGGNNAEVSDLEALPMQPMLTYNVKLGAWHSVVMSRDAVILLVENVDTDKVNSEYLDLTDPMKQAFLQTARQFLDWADL